MRQEESSRSRRNVVLRFLSLALSHAATLDCFLSSLPLPIIVATGLVMILSLVYDTILVMCVLYNTDLGL